jgi:hypothetical protein
MRPAMTCERWQFELSEAAAGAARSTAFEAHLAGCECCRARFAAEQALYSNIDSGLALLANAEVPAQLPAAVRRRLTAAPRWSPSAKLAWIPAFALAAAVAVLLLHSHAVRQAPEPFETPGQVTRAQPAEAIPSLATHEPSARPGRPAIEETVPEPTVAFVPEPQRAAMVHLVQGLQSGEISGGILLDHPAGTVEEISIPLLSVEALEVKPLSPAGLEALSENAPVREK